MVKRVKITLAARALRDPGGWPATSRGGSRRRFEDRPPSEDLEARIWRRTIAAGGSLILSLGAVSLVYGVSVAAPAHRWAIGMTTAIAIAIATAVIWWFPWDRVLASRWRETGLVSWSALTIGAIAVTAAFDGGATSPLALALILPALFTSLAFSLRRVVLIGGLSEVAFFALCLVDSPGPRFTLIFCSVLGGTTALAVWQAGLHQEWRNALTLSARTDPLTGLLNRRGLAIASAAAFSDLSRKRGEVTLLVMDLDEFKAYNDTYGHQAGDDLLRWTAGELIAAVRTSDAVGRLGGDEFAVLVPGRDRDLAAAVVDRLWRALQQRVGFSVGCASAPRDGESFDELYRVADFDLCRRKLLRSRGCLAVDPRGAVGGPSAQLTMRLRDS
jgi:diguanylate cyclase (GGDEF)-like protein